MSELSAERREALTDALVMSPLSDYIGTDLTPVVRTSDALAPLIAGWLAEAKGEALRPIEALADRWHQEASQAKRHGTPDARMSKRYAARCLVDAIATTEQEDA